MQYISLKRTHWLKKYKNLASFPNLNSKNKNYKKELHTLMYHVKQQAVYSKMQIYIQFFWSCHVTLDPFTMAKSRTYRFEDRKHVQTWVCAHLRQTQSHLPWEIPALMWKQQQSHLPGYKPGLQIVLLTMTVILDLKEQRGRRLRQAPPPFKWNRITGKKWTGMQLATVAAFDWCTRSDEPAKTRTPGH